MQRIKNFLNGRRNSIRVPIELPLNLSDQNEVIQGKGVNLSEEGVCLQINKSFVSQNSSFVAVSLDLDANQIFRAKVVWENLKNEHRYLGIHFLELDNDKKNILKSFVGNNLSQTLLAERRKDIRRKTILPIDFGPRRRFDRRTLKIPRAKTAEDYSDEFVAKRREWLSRKTGANFNHLAHYSENPQNYKGNVENFIGVAQVPIGVAGPLKINGQFAKGIFYVPMATTEGALVSAYEKGMVALTEAGGVNTIVVKDENMISPVFIFSSAIEARKFVYWVAKNFERIKEEAEKTTHYGKLLKITPYQIGRRIILNFSYFTGDAMGANMINVATEEVCRYILGNVKNIESYLLRSNFSSEKKPSFFNFIQGYGKEVIADVIIPRRTVKEVLGATPEEMVKAWHSWALGTFQSGMIGGSAHYANGLAAIFTACGQDIAHIVNACAGITSWELTDKGDLYSSVKLPSLLVGTIGGGTVGGTQRECLEMLGCYGNNKAKKFAEVIAATILAGENGFGSAVVSGQFLDLHKLARSFIKKLIIAE